MKPDRSVVIFWVIWILVVLALIGFNSKNDRDDGKDYAPQCYPGPFGSECD